MTYADFVNVFAILAVQLRASDADESTMRAYFHALKDLPLEAIQASAVALSRESGRRFFPTTAEWRDAANESRVKVMRELGAREEPWRLECERCEDTGWTIHDCAGDNFCGRQKEHYAHTFARPCPCRPTNRTWQRHQYIGRSPSV